MPYVFKEQQEPAFETEDFSVYSLDPIPEGQCVGQTPTSKFRVVRKSAGPRVDFTVSAGSSHVAFNYAKDAGELFFS